MGFSTRHKEVTILYYLPYGVYLVKGEKNSALYDLNQCRLYQINNEAALFVEELLSVENKELSIEKKAFKKKLIELKLLQEVYTKPHYITDLKKDNVIDFVWIEITTCCNLKCIHCYENASCHTEKIMDFDLYKRIIDELIKNDIKKIQFIGGEPFTLGKQIFKYLDYCINKFEYIEIFTNGTLISTKWLSYIKKNNIRLALSVYSYNEKVHCYVTGDETSWRKTNELIKQLSEYGIKYRVRNVIMKDVSIGQKNTELYKLTKKRDIVRITGRAKLNLLTDELIKCKLITPQKLTKVLNENLIVRCISGHNCFSRRLYFSYNGDVFPCVMERRFKHGSIINKSLVEVIDNRVRNITKDFIKECKNCEFRYCCFDCRPDSNGNEKYDKPWYCTYNPIEGKWETDINKFIEQLRENNHFKEVE